ncbi:cathepsin L2-like isoform 3-T4 [Liasis olivaceus]
MPSISVVALAWLVSLRTFSTALDPTLEGTWRDWKATHSKEYIEQEEESFRRAVWEENLQMIQDHNTQADLGKHTYRLGMNHFGDLGECGSCWSFSATGALEAMHFKKTGKLVSLSEQNLIDCSKEQGSSGCQGGLMHQAFEYVKKQGGINSEKSYPYDGMDDYSCRYDPENSATRCSSMGVIMTGDEEGLQQAVAMVGPVSVGVDARSSEFHFYKSGIFKSPWLGDPNLNHAVLVVGYNSSSSKYWIVKNSWSSVWGDNGYMHMEQGSNQCGIADMACYPVP